MEVTTEKRPDTWTDPNTGKRYVLKERDEDVAVSCLGCAGDHDTHVCAYSPSCRGGTCNWVEDEK